MVAPGVIESVYSEATNRNRNHKFLANHQVKLEKNKCHQTSPALNTPHDDSFKSFMSCMKWIKICVGTNLFNLMSWQSQGAVRWEITLWKISNLKWEVNPWIWMQEPRLYPVSSNNSRNKLSVYQLLHHSSWFIVESISGTADNIKLAVWEWGQQLTEYSMSISFARAQKYSWFGKSTELTKH